MGHKEEILKLKEGEKYIATKGINDDCGIAEIELRKGLYRLSEIPTYGGKPIYAFSFTKEEVNDLIEEFERWT